MATTDESICNTALAYLGDPAKVTSVNPPDQSVQAAYCNRFYEPTRDALLEMYAWGFATVRESLQLLQNNPASSQWAYAYAAPNNVINYLEILDPLAVDDYSTASVPMTIYPGVASNGIGVLTPQPFVVESQGPGLGAIIYTNMQNAMLRYTIKVTDPSRFSPLFTECLALLLSSKLAGPIIKGAEGRAAALAQMQAFQIYFKEATESDANQRRLRINHGPAWMAGR